MCSDGQIVYVDLSFLFQWPGLKTIMEDLKYQAGGDKDGIYLPKISGSTLKEILWYHKGIRNCKLAKLNDVTAVKAVKCNLRE